MTKPLSLNSGFVLAVLGAILARAQNNTTTDTDPPKVSTVLAAVIGSALLVGAVLYMLYWTVSRCMNHRGESAPLTWNNLDRRSSYFWEDPNADTATHSRTAYQASIQHTP